jgi:hypothetical protein
MGKIELQEDTSMDKKFPDLHTSHVYVRVNKSITLDFIQTQLATFPASILRAFG